MNKIDTVYFLVGRVGHLFLKSKMLDDFGYVC